MTAKLPADNTALLAPEVVITSVLILWDPGLKVLVDEWWAHVTAGEPYDAPADRIQFLIAEGGAVLFEGVSPTHHGASAHWTGYESCSIEIQPDGGVRVAMGVTDQGQGTTTFVATLTADALGVPLETVHVELADSDSTPYGLGAFGSRQAVIGGGAILTAAATVRDKIKQIAAHMLEAPEDDLVIEDGHVHVQGSPVPAVTIAQIATAATIRTLDLPPGVEPGLEATAR